MKKTSLWLAIIVGLQIAWMGATAATKEYQLKHGKVVLLETVPADPRDLLRGDYVTLRYKISDIPIAFFPSIPTNGPQSDFLNDAFTGHTVYVVLEPRGQFYEAVSAGFEMPRVTGNQVVIRGTVTPERWRWRSGSIHVFYEIERYYVPEGTGNPIGKVTVNVALGSEGSAIIKQVLVNGKPYAEAIRDQNRMR